MWSRVLAKTWIGTVLLCACDLGGESAPPAVDACKGTVWPSLEGTVLRAAPCGSDAGDGSLGRPFKTAQAALAKAQAGTTVLLAAGTYSESLTLPAGVGLAGAGTGVNIEPPDGIGVLLKGAGEVRLQGFSVRKAKGSGVQVDGASVTLADVVVEGTLSGATTQGHGIQVVNASKVIIEACRSVDNAGVGIYVARSGPVSIIDPLFQKDPKAAGSPVAIIDPLFTPRSVVAGNGQDGIAIIDPLFAPAAGGTPTLTLTATDVRGNRKTGLLLAGASAALVRSVVRGTLRSANGEVAAGVSVMPVADGKVSTVSVRVDAATVVTGNERAGVMIAAPADVEIAGEVSANARFGVWAKGSSVQVELPKTAHLAQNGMVGVVVTDGATLEVDGARISGTKAVQMPTTSGATAEVADAIGVYGQAHARISGATLSGNPRAGIVAKHCAATAMGLPDVEIKGTTITGSKYGVVVNGQYSQSGGDPAAAAAPKNAGNSYDNVDNESSGVDLPVPDSAP